MNIATSLPLRLTVDRARLAGNWRWLAGRNPAAACGAAVKADGYGLGAGETVATLAAAGCRDFFVATWAEAAALGSWERGLDLSVFHGVREEDVPAALALPYARPVLNTPAQIARWLRVAPGRPCDLMVDTGMNRLGLTPAEAASGLAEGLVIDTLMSHLACADEDSALTVTQRRRFRDVAASLPARRLSLANSAGICLGSDYAFDLTRPGLALYGGVPRGEAVGHIGQVARIEAQLLQVRNVPAGETIGYGATHRTDAAGRVGILNLGYADGYPRLLSNRGHALHRGTTLPLLGLVSMDLAAIGLNAAPDLAEGDWVEVDFDLPRVAAIAGLSQYELLTGLGHRYHRRWI